MALLCGMLLNANVISSNYIRLTIEKISTFPVACSLCKHLNNLLRVDTTAIHVNPAHV